MRSCIAPYFPWLIWVLVFGTSMAVASLSWWLVPPYLAVMGLLLFEPVSRRVNATNPTDRVTTHADVNPFADTSNPVDDTGSNQNDPSASGGVGVKTRRASKTRLKKPRPVIEPAPAAWIQVAPGKFVRVEPGSEIPGHEPSSTSLDDIGPSQDESDLAKTDVLHPSQHDSHDQQPLESIGSPEVETHNDNLVDSASIVDPEAREDTTELVVNDLEYKDASVNTGDQEGNEPTEPDEFTEVVISRPFDDETDEFADPSDAVICHESEALDAEVDGSNPGAEPDEPSTGDKAELWEDTTDKLEHVGEVDMLTAAESEDEQSQEADADVSAESQFHEEVTSLESNEWEEDVEEELVDESVDETVESYQGLASGSTSHARAIPPSRGNVRSARADRLPCGFRRRSPRGVGRQRHLIRAFPPRSPP